MLRNTFCHIPSIGTRTEARLWDAGVRTWEDALADDLPLAPGKREILRQTLAESRERYDAGDADHFAQRLPVPEHWRMLPDFGGRAAYVDIETTGMAPPACHITAIALYDGQSVRSYVHGQNLEAFQDDILGYDLLVTFNGRCFDAPFIERELRIPLPKAHIDLRFALAAAGVKGGLKRVEKHFGISRGELDGVDGYDAVLLWDRYEKTGDERALRTLLAYNIEDVINLEVLAYKAFNLLIEPTPFALSGLLPEPEPFKNPLEPDPAVVADLRRMRHF